MFCKSLYTSFLAAVSKVRQLQAGRILAFSHALLYLFLTPFLPVLLAFYSVSHFRRVKSEVLQHPSAISPPTTCYLGAHVTRILTRLLQRLIVGSECIILLQVLISTWKRQNGLF